MTRRRFITLASLLSLGSSLVSRSVLAASAPKIRDFQVCLSPQAVLEDPEFPGLLAQAGISRAWLAAYFYGHWPWSIHDLTRARQVLRDAGLATGIVNVPLGHPGDSLGSRDGNFPLTPPAHWKLCSNADGTTHAGTSLHQPGTEENAVALSQLRKAGFSQFFLDDDFRLARGPGAIGGCFCELHHRRFMHRTGFSENLWPELLADVRERRMTKLLREWVEFTCDDLTTSFHEQASASEGNLGIMVMFLGAEKAGIRLKDYRGVPFRVGELMFDDRAFEPIKGKTDELFSALFHRRFCQPELAWSETTAYPADRLSAANMAAKLVISTLADVRHTMFMSGVTPLPKTHWTTLGPEMKRQHGMHEVLAGHRPRGPFKHFWGDASRFMGDDRPFSLFLAAGIPFEVSDKPATDGWTFLSDADAESVRGGHLRSGGTRFVARSSGGLDDEKLEACDETMEALFALKHRLLPELDQVPFVENDVPAVLAWFPSAQSALLWNPRGEKTTCHVRCGSKTREVTLQALESTVLPELCD